MLIFNKSIITKFAPYIVLATLLPLSVYFFFFQTPKVKKSKVYKMLEVLPEFMARVQNDWQYGSFNKLSQMDNRSCKFLAESDVHDDFLSCNPLYLNCLYEHYQKDKFNHYKFKKYRFIPQLNEAKRYVDHRDEVTIVNFLELKTRKLFSLKLQNSCGQKKLPKNTYSATTLLDPIYSWDNYDYSLYIDRHYKTNFDVYRWTIFKKDKTLQKKFNSFKNFKKPALKLEKKYHEDVCHFYGGYLLESRVLDAASFLPNTSKTFYKHPFPWTKERTSFLGGEGELNLANCKNAFVADCEKFISYDHLARFSMSWMGISNTLGGYPEHVRNTFVPNANLAPSSLFLAKNSPWHRVGLRAQWRGENLFDFKEQYSEKVYKVLDDIKGVAFRCMYLR